jgi:hypothetical protein
VSVYVGAEKLRPGRYCGGACLSPDLVGSVVQEDL